jgi:nucleotide-binding universal stress UspA family protein
VAVPATLLLCHHGTEGAALAEARAHEVAEPGRTRLVHLFVVPDLWAGMQGDDWLNNASTRDDFGRYVEGLLEREAREQIDGVRDRCINCGIAHESLLRVGDPAACAVAAAKELGADLVVIGPPRPKGAPGLRSRMELETLVRGLPCPLLIAHRP